MPRIAGLITAAGRSERMGFPKALHPFGDSCFVETLVKVFQQCDLAPICVTLPEPPHFEKVLEKVEPLHILSTKNRWPWLQMQGSIRSCYPIFKDCDALVLCPVDSPHVSQTLIFSLLEVLEKNAKSIVQPFFKNTPGHPLLVSQHFFHDLSFGNLPKGAQSLLKQHSSFHKKLNWNEEAIARNYNFLLFGKDVPSKSKIIF